jgi:hypothetical protein
MTRIRKGSKRLESQVSGMNRVQLLAALDKICEALRKPLPVTEFQAGWTTSRVLNYLALFERLKSDVTDGVRIPYMPIVKMLDHSGIVSGELLKDASRIDVALNERDW